MAGRGRRGPASALTDEVRDEIGRRLASGCSLEVAAEAVGVSRRTIQAWLAAGRDAEAREAEGKRLTARQADCLALLKAEQTARAELRVKALASIQKAALQGNYQAAAWLLERLFPDEFGPKRGREAQRPGRPVGAVSAPDRSARPGTLRAVP
jgi:transposase